MSKTEYNSVEGNLTATAKHAGETVTESNDDWLLDALPGNSAVTVRLKRTYNLGNYESLTIGVDLSLPCKETMDDWDRAFDEAFDWCRGKITAHAPKCRKD